MATIATRKTRTSDLIKGEFGLNENYERLVKSVTATATTEIGTVFDPDTNAALVAANVATATVLWVCVDDKVDEITASGTHALAMLVGGPGGSGHATIVREELKFGDSLSSGQIDTVTGLLKAQGIRVVRRTGAEG